MVYYYAVVDDLDVVYWVTESDTVQTGDDYIQIDSLDESLLGKWYDRSTQTFKPGAIVQILEPLKEVDGADSGLDADTLDGKHASEFALANHTHEGATSGNYLPLTGGAVTGDVDITGELDIIDGLIRLDGQQAFFNSGTNLVIGTNNLPTIIACKADKDVTINGTNLACGHIHPRAHGSHGIGVSSKRWKDVYLVNSPNVSSDERLKQDIVSVDVDEMLAFVDKLRVVDYAFKDNPDVERIGLIAQEVEKAGGEKYIDIGDDGMYGLRGADLVYPLIAAVQALSKRVAELEKQ